MSKRTYQVMDCLRSLDLRSGNFVPSARTRIGGSHDGDVDYGHDCKSIYEYDNFGLLWVKQEPGVDSPYNDYVFHPGADEIELTVEGECIMRYADGEGGPLVPGVCTYIPAGVPHGNHHPGIEDVVLLVFYPKPISQVGRGDHKMGEPYTGGKKHEMINFYEAPAQEIAPGHSSLSFARDTESAPHITVWHPAAPFRSAILSPRTAMRLSLCSAGLAWQSIRIRVML